MQSVTSTVMVVLTWKKPVKAVVGRIRQGLLGPDETMALLRGSDTPSAAEVQARVATRRANNAREAPVTMGPEDLIPPIAPIITALPISRKCVCWLGATPTRVNAHAISDLTFQTDHAVCIRRPRCLSGFRG